MVVVSAWRNAASIPLSVLIQPPSLDWGYAMASRPGRAERHILRPIGVNRAVRIAWVAPESPLPLAHPNLGDQPDKRGPPHTARGVSDASTHRFDRRIG